MSGWTRGQKASAVVCVALAVVAFFIVPVGRPSTYGTMTSVGYVLIGSPESEGYAVDYRRILWTMALLAVAGWVMWNVFRDDRDGG